jgi:hypothetical protein
MDWQQFAAFLLVAAAALYLGLRAARKKGICSGCNSCDAAPRPDPSRRHELISLDPPAKKP